MAAANALVTRTERAVAEELRQILVLKGGTALHKFHAATRLSLDLDFTASRPVTIDDRPFSAQPRSGLRWSGGARRGHDKPEA